jgi:chemotaxis protein MotB
MMNIRYRSQTNAWPGFVDLFSNLVIILIFLLIMFVFLWTTTSVFNKTTGTRAVAELKQVNAEQAQTIEEMENYKREANRLLLMARDELESVDTNTEDLIGAYENKIANLQSEINEKQTELTEMQGAINELATQLNHANISREQSVALEQERKALQDQMSAQYAELTAQLEKLQAALDAAEEKSRAQEVEYIEMSNRLNKALADKVAELNDVSKYQSQFYKAVKMAMGDRTTITTDGDRFIVNSDILFPSGSYKLSAAGKKQLKVIANVIKDMENKIPSDIDWIIRVDGHTDKKQVISGTRGYRNNTQLSLLRASAVADELAANGVSKRRLIPTGFGEMYPISLGNDAASLQKNRRIELQLTNR